jgi:MAF protein
MKNTFLPFVLASNSPRRKELLSLTGEPFRVQPADINEDTQRGEGAQDYVSRLANEKAETVGAVLTDQDVFILAADTTVVLDGQILAKPADAIEAKTWLTNLRGRSHMVYTGISILRQADGARLTDLAATEVPMRNYSEEEMNEYVDSGSPLDKAGAYGIQHAGFHPVENMTGCYANVVGLPLCHLQRTLQKWNISFDVDLPAACQRHLAYECPVTEKILNWEL